MGTHGFDEVRQKKVQESSASNRWLGAKKMYTAVRNHLRSFRGIIMHDSLMASGTVGLHPSGGPQDQNEPSGLQQFMAVRRRFRRDGWRRQRGQSRTGGGGRRRDAVGAHR